MAEHRRPKSETKDISAQDSAGNVNFMFKSIPIAPQVPRGYEDMNPDGCWACRVSVSQLRNSEFRKPSILEGGC